jgi:type III pantothenate kinase
MNLCIDIGNTRAKMAVFNAEGSLVKLIVRDDVSTTKLDKVLQKYQIKHAILSSTRKKNSKLKRLLESKAELFIDLSPKTAIPITNLYQSPETLGNDRLAGIIGAAAIFPESNILIADAGTCITYDFIDATGQYFGGSILAGIDMRFKALNHFTERLPIAPFDLPESYIGDTTISSIQTGVLLGVVYEMQGFISKYRALHPDLRVLITGGDASYFESQLENQIFAVPNLVLTGLNQILTYNVQQQKAI